MLDMKTIIQIYSKVHCTNAASHDLRTRRLRISFEIAQIFSSKDRRIRELIFPLLWTALRYFTLLAEIRIAEGCEMVRRFSYSLRSLEHL